jgi:subtilisin family serine protease
MNVNPVIEPRTTPTNRSRGALVLFLFCAIPMPLCLLTYHFILWFSEQMALASGSLDDLKWTGMLGLAVQAVLLSGFTAVLWQFGKDQRFKPVYAGWLVAALMGFPALGLRWLGPNNDQLGFIAQTVLCVGAFFIVRAVRGVRLDRRPETLSTAFLLAAFGVLPFAVLGAFGSPIDALLGLLAGMSFGLLASTLLEATTGNRYTDAFGYGAALALLGSALGYDGSQLILLSILPGFAFAFAQVMPSRTAAMALSGVLAAAGLIFFDPTELTIVLGDVGTLALQAGMYAIGLGLLVGFVGLVVQFVTGAGAGSGAKRAGLWLGAGAAWLLVLVLFFAYGHRGFYGDRLFVVLKEQADLADVRALPDIDARRTAAYQQLTQLADESQAGLRRTFDTFGVKYTPYYLVNALEVRGGMLVRLYLLTRPEVDRILPSPKLRPARTVDALALSKLFAEPAPEGVQWNVSMIGADKVWEEFGVRGEGIVIGQSDSGVDVTHPDVQASYRGKESGADYNWLDPWNGQPAPYDDNGHGTHTLGTVLGQNGIGVAPGATWFACMNLNRNLGNPALYLDCLQFMLAPYPQGGDPLKDGYPTRAADVLNNSWGCPEIEGCDPEALLFAANHLRDAGIFVVVSAGNDGPSCNTVTAPLALYDSVFSVGAVDESGNVTEFSSRGPVTADGSGRMKPDIVAPGHNILSALPGGGYGALEGTSMAGPHVAGAVALLWSADPSLIGDIDRTEQILIETAQPYTGSDTGCFEGENPNAAYGYGLVDVYAAVKQALGR